MEVVERSHVCARWEGPASPNACSKQASDEAVYIEVVWLVVVVCC